jgi:hypothetical protein
MKVILKVISFYIIIHQTAFAQQTKFVDTLKYKTVIAGSEYQASAWHQKLWGSNYRGEWTTPVKVPVLMLDTAKGGLIPYESGGGHQTKSLHSRSTRGKEYTLRSVNKTLSKVLPESVQGTFLEKQVNDEVSMSHPYAASAVPLMAEQAHIYHTYPVYVYLPGQRALDSFNNKYGNNLYLFEQRLDGNWKDANNLGNFETFLGTDEVREKLYEENDRKVDQRAFVRARIFDWFLGDWDRHEEQWKWGERKTGDGTIYVPVPQDRDQAFSKHNGVMLNFAMSAGGLSYMQSFDDDLKNITTFTYEERNLDRFFANEMTLADWQSIAKDLQQLLTDEVIEASVKQLPPEVFAISGNEIISKLKSRRTHLEEWATTYYLFLAKEVQVTGSKLREQFEVKRLNDDETSVNVYNYGKRENKNTAPLYSRVFKTNETQEIRLFGLSGRDKYTIEGNVNHGITVRIIGGNNKDSVVNTSGGGKVYVYDNENNFIQPGSGTKLRISNDSTVHAFQYDWYKYDKKGIKPSIFYNYDDRIYVGLGYQSTHFKWRKEPFASKQLFDVHYSLGQQAFSVNYNALFPQLIGKADLALKANYDAVRWTRFFGLGNETQFIPADITYFTTRTEEWIVQPGIIRRFGMNTITLSGFYQAVKVINDEDRFIGKSFAGEKTFQWSSYAGADLNYKLQWLNDSVVPTKGFIFSADALGVRNLQEGSKSFVKYSGNLQLYIPLVSKFSYLLRTGAAVVKGAPEFYQYAPIGGPTLRGFRRDRFRGKTAFYNTNDLRFISNVKTYIFTGKAGLLAFVDDGRVWMPGENSNTWHVGYGGGIILAPFNKILAEVTYGLSKEDKLVQLRVTKYL